MPGLDASRLRRVGILRRRHWTEASRLEVRKPHRRKFPMHEIGGFITLLSGAAVTWPLATSGRRQESHV